MTERVCHECDGKMIRDTRPMTFTYKGGSTTFDLPGWYCDSCDESLHIGPDLIISGRALNTLKARVEGVLEPAAIRRIRKKLRLTQKEAGRLIGGGPNAFQKYECGDVLASHAISSALRLLDANPESLAILRKQAESDRAA